MEGIPVLLIGLELLAGHGVLPVTGGVAMLFAVLLLWGSPAVVVNAAGQGLNSERAGRGSSLKPRRSWKHYEHAFLRIRKVESRPLSQGPRKAPRTIRNRRVIFCA